MAKSDKQNPKRATQVATDPKQAPFHPAPIGAPQPVQPELVSLAELFASRVASTPWPKFVEPRIWQYDDNVFVWTDATGNVHGAAKTLDEAREEADRYLDSMNSAGPEHVLNALGYDQLAQVLADAFHQASAGKGAERHANQKPFHEQPMQRIAERRGIGFILGQADKKSEEAQGMLERGEAEASIRELLGAIVYLSGAVIHIRNSKS